MSEPDQSSQDPTELLARMMGAQDADIPAKPEAPDYEAPEPVAEGDDAPAEAPEPERFKVKVDGKEIEVTRDELLNGYSRQADYSRKTQELAEHRKQIEQAAQAIQAERGQYQAQLGQMAQALGQQLQEQSQTDWQSLLESDPVEYLKQRHLFEQRQAAYSQAQQARQRAAVEAQQQQLTAYQSRLQSEHQALLDKLPDWKDEAKASSEKSKLREYLTANGYQGEEVDGVADHRAIVMARKAMMYDEMVKQAETATEKVKSLPPQRVVKPGAQISPTDGRTSAMRNLAKTGSTDAAAAVLMGMFNR